MRDSGSRRGGSRPAGALLVAFGWVLLPVGVVLDMIAFAVALPGPNLKTLWGPVVGIVVGVIGLGVIVLARYLRRQGKRHLSAITTVGEVLAAPPFVLYLRSFPDDRKLGAVSPQMTSSRSYNHEWAAMQGVRTEEEQLRVATAPFGPMVAVGRPGEHLPEIGARRLYVDHHEWQDAVRRLMAEAGRSGLVVLSAGLSEGLRWEFEQAARIVPPWRLVLVIALSPPEYEEFRMGTGRVFRRPLPDYPRSRTVLKYRAKIRGAVYFDPDWTPHFVRFDTPESPGNFQRIIESRFVYGLRPVYDRLRVRWPGLPLRVPTHAHITRRQIPVFTLLLMVGVLILVGFVRFLLNGGSG